MRYGYEKRRVRALWLAVGMLAVYLMACDVAPDAPVHTDSATVTMTETSTALPAETVSETPSETAGETAGETADKIESESAGGTTDETVGDSSDESQPDWDVLYPADTLYVLTNEHLFEVGRERNIVVFIVDRFDARYVDNLEAARPGYFEAFEDFTYYNNNVSSFSRTYPAVGAMLTGVIRDFAPGTTAEGYFENAYQNSPLLHGLKDAGFAVHLYTHATYAYRNARAFRGLVDNIGEAEAVDTVKADITDDVLFATLKHEGLKLGESADSFALLHLNGTHYPYQIDENGNKAEEGAGSLGATLGSMKFIQMYVDGLKELGLYENTTIIITGDHPDPISDYKEPTRARPTALFVKRANVSHPYRISSAPVSDLDLIPSLLEDAQVEPTKDFGTAYWEVEETAVRPRYHYFPLNAKAPDQPSLTIYEVVGDARDFANWKRLRNESLNGSLYR